MMGEKDRSLGATLAPTISSMRAQPAAVSPRAQCSLISPDLA